MMILAILYTILLSLMITLMVFLFLCLKEVMKMAGQNGDDIIELRTLTSINPVMQL